MQNAEKKNKKVESKYKIYTLAYILPKIAKNKSIESIKFSLVNIWGFYKTKRTQKTLSS